MFDAPCLILSSTWPAFETNQESDLSIWCSNNHAWFGNFWYARFVLYNVLWGWVTLGHSNQANNNCFPFTLVHMLVKDLPTFQIQGLHMHAIYRRHSNWMFMLSSWYQPDAHARIQTECTVRRQWLTMVYKCFNQIDSQTSQGEPFLCCRCLWTLHTAIRVKIRPLQRAQAAVKDFLASEVSITSLRVTRHVCMLVPTLRVSRSRTCVVAGHEQRAARTCLCT